MLAYRHAFHAGNHADVLKHAVLSLILEGLKGKEKAFVYIDTHAGAGRYDLQSAAMVRTGEYHSGIERLWRASCPDLLSPYLGAVRALNPDGRLRFYPGSPLLAQLLRRPQDRLMLSELHSTDFPLLQSEFAGKPKSFLFQEDGYQMLKAALPPQERRGLVLIDPPYELKQEYQDLIKGLQMALQRWRTGTYLIWYPVVLRHNVSGIEKRLTAISPPKTLQIELNVLPEHDQPGMTGSGLLVINPPWQLERQMTDLLPWLTALMAQSAEAGYRLRWLVPESVI